MALIDFRGDLIMFGMPCELDVSSRLRSLDLSRWVFLFFEGAFFWFFEASTLLILLSKNKIIYKC